MAELKNVSEGLDGVSGGENKIDPRTPFEDLKKKLLAPFSQFSEEAPKPDNLKILEGWIEQNKKFCEEHQKEVKEMWEKLKLSNEG